MSLFEFNKMIESAIPWWGAVEHLVKNNHGVEVRVMGDKAECCIDKCTACQYTDSAPMAIVDAFLKLP